jgi:hypothetical protein
MQNSSTADERIAIPINRGKLQRYIRGVTKAGIVSRKGAK